jgi:hypothetical protein
MSRTENARALVREIKREENEQVSRRDRRIETRKARLSADARQAAQPRSTVRCVARSSR